MDKIRVLLIDDEPSFTRMLKLSLERRGHFEVMVENNGAYGLKVAQDFLPDIILLDVIMPDVDGGEIASTIRADRVLKVTPIVFLTAGVSKETTRAKGNVIGGQKYLAKPATVEEIIRCIETQLRKPGEVTPGSSAVPKS